MGGVGRLQDNFIVASLSDLVSDKLCKKHDVMQCDFCFQSSDDHLTATARCIDCQKSLCEQCYKLHQQNTLSSEHDMYELSVEKDVTCPVHPQEIVRYFCMDCEQCVCIVCACGTAKSKFSHSEHRLTNFRTAAAERRPQLTDKLFICKEKERRLNKRLQSLDKFKEIFVMTKESIEAACQYFHKQIDQAEERLLSQLDDKIEPELKHMMDDISDLQAYQEQLCNTCSLTELMLAGSDIELMIMAKQLSEKLNVLNDKHIELPELCQNELLKFEKGHLNFGHIVYGTEYIKSGEQQSSVEVQCKEVSTIEVALCERKN